MRGGHGTGGACRANDGAKVEKSFYEGRCRWVFCTLIIEYSFFARLDSVISHGFRFKAITKFFLKKQKIRRGAFLGLDPHGCSGKMVAVPREES